MSTKNEASSFIRKLGFITEDFFLSAAVYCSVLKFLKKYGKIPTSKAKIKQFLNGLVLYGVKIKVTKKKH